MRIYMMTDMEGVSGIRRGDKGYTSPGTATYPIGQRLLTGDVNAAVEGALLGGAETVIVNDGHGGGCHILMEDLHSAAELESPISGRRSHYMPSLDESFDAMFIVGAHAMAGTPKAFLDHTQSSASVYNYLVNGKKYGEIGQYALFAGHFGVPVVLVTGDLAATVEARELLGDIETVSVKEGLARNVARSICPRVARQHITEAAQRAVALAGKAEPLRLTPPLRVRLELQRTEQAEAYENRRNVERVEPRAAETTVESQLDILNIF